ncbi:MAG: hypothetical protein HKP60_04170 [Eudoraea sp.]|nr:hypothetical protein [Eudoraea sp.]NNJ40049.1 hypothetical protein [Eudoraea sp.]
MRKLLALGPIGGSGCALSKIGKNNLIYNGAPAVKITYDIPEDKIRSMTVALPNFTIQAEKVR